MAQDNIQDYVSNVTQRASEVRAEIAAANSDTKNLALKYIAEEILSSSENLKEKNKLDLQAGKERGLANAMLDRLELTDARIKGMAEGFWCNFNYL